MTLTHLLLLDALLVGLAAFFFQQGLQGAARAREAAAWPVGEATAIATQQVAIPHGRATVVRGSHSLGGVDYAFERRWGLSDFEGGRWVPPPGTPAAGQRFPLRYNPARPAEVAFEHDAADANVRRDLVASAALTTLATVAALAWWWQRERPDATPRRAPKEPG